MFETYDFSADQLTSIPVYSGIQHRAAFLMAIKEINNKSDGIADNLLPNAYLLQGTFNSQGNNYLNTIINMYSALNSADSRGLTINGMIGPSGDTSTANTAALAQQFGILQLGYNAFSPLFSDNTAYPLMSRVCAQSLYESDAIASILAAYFGWKRVITFSSTDVYGTAMLSEFISQAGQRGINIVTSIKFGANRSDFSNMINSVLPLGAYIYVFLMNSHDAGTLLEQGYKLGLFVEGTQIIGSSATITTAPWMYMHKSADLPVIMKGFMAVTPYYSFSNPIWQRFVRNFRSQPNTQGLGTYDEYGYLQCDYALDDPGNYMYYYDGSLGGTQVCLGLNFSSFAKDGSNIDPYAPYAYDAVYSLAYAFQYLHFTKNKTTFTGYDVLHALAYNVSFTGATGYINFVNGAGVTLSGQGERNTDVNYVLKGFNLNYLNVSRNISGMVSVLLYNSDNGIQDCSFCNKILYNTADNSKPYDSTPVKVIRLSSTQTGTIFALMILASVTVFFFAMVLVLKYQTRIIRSSQPAMLALVLLGGVLGCVQISMGTDSSITDQKCVASVWFSHLAFGVAFSGVLTKVWVIDKICNSPVKKVRISLADAFFNVFIALLILVGFLVLITVIDQPQAYSKVTTSVFNPLEYRYCKGKSTTVTSLLYVVEAFGLAYAVKLSWAIRGVPDALKESKVLIGCKSNDIYVCIYAVSSRLTSVSNCDCDAVYPSPQRSPWSWWWSSSVWP